MSIKGIRAKIMLIILIAIVPSAALVVFIGMEIQQNTRTRLLAEAQRLVDGLADQHAMLNESTLQILRTLAQTPVVRTGHKHELDLFLEDLLLDSSVFATILVADADATVIATGVDRDGYTLADRPYVFEYNLDRGFHAGNLVYSRSTGRPVIPFMYPYTDPGGAYAGFVLAAFDVTHYPRFLSKPNMPEGSVIRIADSRGVIVYSSDNETELWRALSPSIWSRIVGGEETGIFTDYSSAGNPRAVVMFSSVRALPDRAPYLHLTVSIPYDTFFVPLREIVTRNTWLAGIAFIAALVLGYLAATMTVVRRVEMLVGATEQIARGEISPVYPKLGGADEISRLGRSIDEMARTIHSREQDLRDALGERELLLRELHHRVKNNFQVLASLLSLQTDAHQDARVRVPLEEGRNRVLSMALIHERFSGSQEPAQIDFAAYLQDLLSELQATYEGHAVHVDIETETVTLDLESATPLGLIVNEAVSNAFKHAFHLLESGRLRIGLSLREELVRVTVHDDGPGLPAEFDPKHASSLGFMLIRILVDQLKGTWHIESGPQAGTCLTVEFPLR